MSPVFCFCTLQGLEQKLRQGMFLSIHPLAESAVEGASGKELEGKLENKKMPKSLE